MQLIKTKNSKYIRGILKWERFQLQIFILNSVIIYKKAENLSQITIKKY